MRFLQSSCKPGWNYGLEQIVECIYFKGLQRVLIISGGENDFRDILQLAQQIKSRHSRHLDIEEQQVGIMFADQGQRLVSVRCFPDDLYFRMRGQKTAKLQSSDPFIVEDQRFHEV